MLERLISTTLTGDHHHHHHDHYVPVNNNSNKGQIHFSQNNNKKIKHMNNIIIIICILVCVAVFSQIHQNKITNTIMAYDRTHITYDDGDYHQYYYNSSATTAIAKQLTESSLSSCTLDQSDLKQTRIYQQQQHSELDCKDTNYMIIIPPTRGFGAMIRTLVAKIGMGMNNNNNNQTQYIVHWEWNTGFMRGVYNASQCPNENASNAWECFFEPISKCTLDDALDMVGATNIKEIPFSQHEKQQKVKKTQQLSSTNNPHGRKVVKVNNFAQYRIKNSIPSEILEPIQPQNLPNRSMGEGVSDPWQSQLTRYLLRFNKETDALLQPHMESVHLTFTQQNVQSYRSVALMIRGSDKCNEDVSGKKEPHETDCLPLRAYLDAVNNVWKWDQRITDVIVTSEDSRYIDAVKNFAINPPPPGFEKSSSSSSMPDGGSNQHKFTFHFNEQDIQQGSSLPANAVKAGTITSHFDLIKSMWTTIEMAIQARYMIINCDSFFHQLAVVYRQSSCLGNGQAPPVIFCLDHRPKQQQIEGGFDIDTIRKGGSYEGRWEYQASS